ncbi:FG-GAP-like repeat-containing protein [Rhodopirellula sp. P2]|uniref:FG-GAP-like repeat-containing protein n=1 Tax=Rhodopirellula sp. P2 TaxID=2127060 RepID=UPI0023684592|nr:FG-GAP-like repeat-containing protein [Rhodopirellula sp. P2]WDQ16485.1 FG-GAP-like repeat-containing protein [Rhodopirellula sp. P2]
MSIPLRQFAKKLKRSHPKQKRKMRVSRLETLEARRVLAAAIWNNVTEPADVSGEAVPHVSALDALLIINELNARGYSDPEDGELPKQLDVASPGLYYDVSCDNRVSALDALMVINHLNGIRNEGNGVFPSLACSPVIAEGTDFHNSLDSPWLTLPDDSSAIKVYFRTPEFDRTSQNQILDAFEIELTDEQGNPVTLPYAAGRDAAFNWSESYQPTYGAAAEMDAATSEEDSSVTFNLSGLAEGTRVQITTRLVNNDSDDSSQIIIRGYEVVEANGAPPSGSRFESRTPVGSSVDFSQLEDVSGSFVASYGRTSLAGEDNELLTELVVTNQGNQTVTGQLVVVVDDLSELDAAMMHPDGRLPDGRSYWDLTSEMEGNPLAPGQSIRSRQIAFKNDSGKRFSYRLETLGKLNAAPNAFESIPVDAIEAGMTYSYAASASDPEGQSLTYSKVAGPEAMLIDAETGEVTWATDAPDIGSHRVTLRATDPYGLSVEQRFALEVLASLQNRPPIFTSDPVTDAIASSGFEVTTVGVGDSPAGVAVIDGFRGPRLVTANAGDQTIGVYAGQNNDRFDDTTNYSTGFPTADGQLFDVGYNVDIGLPDFVRSGDRNDIDGLAQGDFNGDGTIDLAVAFNFLESGTPSTGTFQVSVVLNDGDGTFASPVLAYEREIGFIYETDVESLSVRDLNGDGFDDIIFAETFAEGRLVTVFSNGDGTFAQPVETTYEDHLIGDFKFADIDSDGIPDLFGRTITSSALGGRSRMLFWSKGNSDGSFDGPNAFAATRNSGSSETTMPYDLADMDGDGDIDFAVSGDNSLIQVFHNDGIGNFTLVTELDPPSAQAYYDPDWLNVADFTGDGHADILYYHVWEKRLDLYMGDETGIDFVFQEGSEVFSRTDNWATDHEPIDLDGDGDLDLVMGQEYSSQASPRVALNNGDGTFKFVEYPMIDFSGDINPYHFDDIARGALVGDYNSDGVLDFSYFTTGNDFNGVGIRLGIRPGEFGGTGSFPIFYGTNGNLVIGDFNGDQVYDLMENRLGETALGNGDGTYSDPIPAVGFVNAYTGSAADFNLDGLDDIVWARSNHYTVGLSNGDGTFTISDDQLAEGSFYGYSSILTKDINNDGYPDFVAKTAVERQIDVHLNDPANPGVFSRSFRYVLPDGSQGINVSNWQESFDVADFNGDGTLDLAFAEREQYSTGSTAYTVVMAGDGAGNFTEISRSPVLGEETMTAAAIGNYYAPGDYNSGDLDGDGDVDLIAATSYGPRVFLNDGSGSFEFHSWLEYSGANQRGRDSWLVDFDEDGILDLVYLGSYGYSQLSVRLGNGDATFQTAQTIGMVGGTGGGISRMPFTDLNGDGHIDFVHGVNSTGNYNADATSFYAGRREDLVDMVAVDLNGDGNEEILAVQEQMDRLQIFVGDNLGGLTRIDDLLTGRAPKAVTTADLDGDSQVELITANRASRDLAVFVGDLESGFTASSVPLDGAPIDVEAADLDGDGNMDLVALDDQSNALWVYAGDGTTTLPEPTVVALGETPSRLSLADATGDGVIDALVTLPESQRVMILSGIGFQPVEAPLYINTASSPSDVAAVDLNDDGNPDLAIALPDSNVLSIVYGRGNNQFARPQELTVGESPTRVTLTDADEDGRMDLVVANSGDGTASVVYNRFDPNEVYKYDSDAIDPDGDTIAYSIQSGPGGLIINSETGELLWAASPDQVGVHDVTVAADDGRGGVATQSFKIEVEPARENAAPIIASMPTTEIGANEGFTYQVQALDNDGHPLRYRLINGPEGSTIDPVTGELAWDTREDGALNTHVPWGTTGYVRTPADESLQPASVTVEGWFNWTQLPAGNGADYLINQVSDLGAAYTLYNRFNDRLRFEANLPGGLEWFEVPFTFEADRWYHFALTIDDATHEVAVYADGQQLATFTLSESIHYTDRIHSIHDGSFQFQGATDNYRIWNVARHPEEIVEGMTTQYENEPALVLDYRFGEEESKSVHDYSGKGNHGYRVTNGNPPGAVAGLVDTGPQEFTLSVEDGRGGYDEQSFILNVLPELRGSITGQLFDDFNGDGDRDDGSEAGVTEEPWIENWHLFIDTNGNSYPDPDEPQATTDPEGKYEFAGLLPNDYPVKVSPVAGYQTPAEFNATVEPDTKRELDPVSVANYDLAIEALSLSQIRGQLQTEDGDAIAYWKAYADLDGDGRRGDDEPMAMSDRNGHFALSGLDAGTYNIKPDVPAGWADSAGRDGLDVVLAADAIATDNDFVLEPTNTSVIGGVHFVTMPSTEIEARQTFRYAAIAMGIGQPAITYDLSLAPEGMAVDPHTGFTAWRPTIDQVGEHLVILRATDASGSISLHDFYLNVTAPNTPPAIRGIGILPVSENQPQDDRPRFPAPTTAYVDVNYSYDVIAQDAESTELTFTLTQSPTSATIAPMTGRIEWPPSGSDVGSHDFTVEVMDAAGATTSATWTVAVENTSPATFPLEVTLPRSTAAVTTNYFSRISARDAIGRPVTWALATGPAELTVSSDGTIEWTPSNSQLGEHAVELEATTADGDTETVSFTVNVLGRLQNAAPVIQSQPHLSATIDQTFQYDILVSDADRDIHAFTLLEGPIGMSVHPSLGSVVWNPAADQMGEHDVLLQVSDPSGATAEQSFTLKVSRFGGPPRITSVPPTEAYVGSGFLYSVQSIDREGDPLSYSLLSAPAGMSIVENTGEIAWTPEAGQVGTQDVVIQVSDGIGGAATQAFVVNVNAGAANLPPAITSVAPRFGAVGTDFDYTLSASDPEGTTITYSLGQGPAGMSVDASTGQVTWIPAAGDEGKHIVTFLATDEGGAAAIESFELDVLDQNTAPSIDSTAPSQSTAGALFTYQVLASDADLDALKFELTEAPEGAEIDAFGRIQWPTELGDEGTYSFEVIVRDPRGGEATQTFDLELVTDTEGPKLSLIERPNEASRNVLPWQGPFVVYVRAIDNVEIASLTLTANGQDIPLDAAGTATFTFEDWTFQSINATATAIDTSGNVTTKTISFDYDIPEGWSGVGGDEIPTAIITSPTDAESVTGMVSISGTAAHEDFDIYRLSYRRVDETTYTEFHSSRTAVENGELGVWDTSLLLNDEYVIRLEVATSEGIANVVERYVGLAGELKLGNFQLSFTDMVIPVAGIPIEITRIYDTLQADREGDFGYGWRLEYRNTDLRVGLPSSGLEDVGIYSALRQGVKVYLNVPGQGRQGFTFDPDIRVLPGWGGNNLVLARPRFTPDPGVTSTLGTGTSSYLHVNDQGELYAPGGIPYNPSSPSFGGAYVLTTREGISYRINGATGKLASATDRNGQSIMFSDSGVTSTQAESAIAISRDAQGRIQAITDPLNHSIQYSYSTAGDLASVEDRLGNLTRFNYNDEKQHYLKSVIDPLGRTPVRTEYGEDGRLEELVNLNGSSIRVQYDPNNSLEVIEDPNGNETFVEYNSFGKAVSLTNALGERQIYEYDRNGFLTSSTNALGQRTTLANNADGWLISATDPLGATTQYSRDENGDLIAIVSPSGQSTTFEYDASGNLLAESGLDGSFVRYEYNSAGHLIGLTDQAGVRTSIEPNPSGLPTTTRYANGAVEKRIYDANGNLTESSVEFEGEVLASTVHEYDEAGRVVATEYADGTRTTSEYNAIGEITLQSDRLGRLNERVKSADGTTVTTVFAGETILESETSEEQTVTQVYGGVTQTVELDALGRPSGVVQSNADSDLGDAISIQYDAAGRVIGLEGDRDSQSVYDAAGREIHTTVDGVMIEREYDSDGQLIKETVEGQTTQYKYDEVGNVTEIAYPSGLVEGFDYDRRENLIAYRQNGVVIRRYQYDEVGRLQAVIDRNQNKTLYTYDGLDRLVEVTHNGQTLRQYDYDLAGNRTLIKREDGSTVVRAYDEANRITQETNPDGTVLTYAYDDFDRVVSRSTDQGVARFSYDDAGYLVSYSNDDTDIAVARDEQGRETRVTQEKGFVGYEYDPNGRLEIIETPAGSRLYEYDSTGLLTSVADPFGNKTSYLYDAEERVTEVTRPDGTIEKLSYTPDSDIESVVLLRADSEVEFSWEYSYDSFGRLSMISTSDGAQRTFHYSDDGFLIAERTFDASGMHEVAYDYDSFGNRIRMVDSKLGETVYEYNLAGQLVREAFEGAEVRYTYDANGNLIKKSSLAETVTYEWDVSGRLTSITTVDGDGTKVTEYIYDAFGKRTAVIRDGVTTYTIYETIDGVARLLEELDENGEVIRSYTYGNELTSIHEGASSSFPVIGGRGDAVAYSGQSGFRLAAPIDAFGRVRTPATNVGDLVIYRGQLLDQDLQMYTMGARHYDGNTGRFVSRDPLEGEPGEPMSYASYIYGLNDPVNNVDPTGLTSLMEQLVTNVLKNRLFQFGIAQFLVGAVLRHKFGSTTWSGPTLNVESQYTGDFSLGYSQFTSETRLTADGYQTADVGVITLSKEIFGKDTSLEKQRNNAKAERLKKRANSINTRKGTSAKQQKSKAKKQDLLAQAESLQGNGLFGSKISFTGGDAEVYSPGLFGLSFGSFVGTFTSAGAGLDASAGSGSMSADASYGGSVVNYGFSAGYSIPDSSAGLSAASKRGQGVADAGFSFGISVGVSIPFEIGRYPAPKPSA